MKRRLRSLEVPPHQEGFWDDLSTRLADEPQELPIADPPRRGPGWLLAPAAAVVVLLAAFGVASLLSGEEPSIEPIGDPEETTTTLVEASTTIATIVPDTTTTSIQEGGAATPWVGELMAQSQAPDPLVTAWNAADNRTWCSALAIADPSITQGYTAREAEFGGGWGVAWDAPDLRSAFGVAGVGLAPEPDTASRWPGVVTYPDGSMLGYGGEGFEAGNPKRLGELVIPGEGCVHQIWSELGDEHLVSVVASLRFVEGMRVEPVELVTEVEVRQGGAAPWLQGTMPVPTIVREQRQEAGLDGPFLFPSTEGLEDATLRPAAIAAWGVAWDMPGEAGHDSFNTPCEACGRGTVGFGEYGRAEGLSAPAGRPLRIEYDDGSYIEIGYYVGDDRIPADRPQFTASDTRSPMLGGYQATIVRADTLDQYVMWSHLGLDHLLDLISGLREVPSQG